MNILSMLGGLSGVGDLIKDIREVITGKKIVDPEKQAEINLKLAQLEQAIQQGQIQINEAEAKNPNWFVAGWRPAIGWVGGLVLFYTYILSPLISWYCKIKGLAIQPPILDTGMLFNLILAMLGFGGYRTYEKVKNVHNVH